ncbi:MRPL15, partial [Symbiodinium sp. KB8]
KRKGRGPGSGFQREFLPINLKSIQRWIDMGRLDASKPITVKELYDSKAIPWLCRAGGVLLYLLLLLGSFLFMRLQGGDQLSTPITIEAQMASKAAIEAVEKAGGSIRTVYYSRLALRAVLKPEAFDIIPRFPKPPPKIMPYYTDYANRGYLSQEVQLKEVQQRLGYREGSEEKEGQQQASNE